MTKTPAQRLYAIALSALLTLATMGGIDRLATHPQDGAAQWAHQPTAVRA